MAEANALREITNILSCYCDSEGVAFVDEAETEPTDVEKNRKDMERRVHAPTEDMELPFSVYLVEEA